MSAFIINKRGPSKGARRLAKALKGRIYKKGDYIPPNSTVINWGDGQCSLKGTDHILNHPDAIQSMANKRDAFDAFSSAGVSIPRYAKSKGGVTWKGPTVVRHKLTGHSGEGIEIHEGQPSAARWAGARPIDSGDTESACPSHSGASAARPAKRILHLQCARPLPPSRPPTETLHQHKGLGQCARLTP